MTEERLRGYSVTSGRWCSTPATRPERASRRPSATLWNESGAIAFSGIAALNDWTAKSTVWSPTAAKRSAEIGLQMLA